MDRTVHKQVSSGSTWIRLCQCLCRTIRVDSPFTWEISTYEGNQTTRVRRKQPHRLTGITLENAPAAHQLRNASMLLSFRACDVGPAEFLAAESRCYWRCSDLHFDGREDLKSLFAKSSL